MAAITAITVTAELYIDDAWEDVSEFVMDWQVRWGRTSCWENMRPYTINLKLLNADRRFEPGCTSSPYYGHFKQGTLLHFALNVTAGDTYTGHLFYGTVNSIEAHYPGKSTGAAYAIVKGADPMAILAKECTYATITSDTADEMVKDVLAEIVWTGGTIDTTNIAAGTAELQAFTGERTPLLDIIENIAFSDQRLFWLQPAERESLAYLQSTYGITAPDTPTLTLTSEDLYDIVLSVDDDECYSHCRLTGQAWDLGDATYDETAGTVEDMWTLAAHGLIDLQQVRFSAVGTGAVGYAADTDYWVIDCSAANYFQLASSEANAIANTPISGTGDSVGTWTLEVCGNEQAASRTADAQWMGYRVLHQDGLLLKTDVEVAARAVDEMNRRHELIGALRPVQVKAKVAVGQEANLNLVGLTVPMASLGVEVTVVTGAGGFPSVRSSSAGEGTADGAGLISVTLPANVQADDLLYVFLCEDEVDEINVGTSGFTRITWDHDAGYRIANGHFCKKAAGTEEGTAVTFAGAAGHMYAYTAYSFKNAADPAVTPPVVSAIASGNSETPTPPECDTGVTSSNYWLACAATHLHHVFTDYPDDMTLNRRLAGTGATSDSAAAASAGIQVIDSAYTPTGHFHISHVPGESENWAAWTVAIPSGISRIFPLYVLGGTITGKPDYPITVTAYTEVAAQFEV